MCSHIPTIHNNWQIRDQASLESQKTAPSSGTMPSLPRPRTHFAHQFFFHPPHLSELGFQATVLREQDVSATRTG